MISDAEQALALARQIVAVIAMIGIVWAFERWVARAYRSSKVSITFIGHVECLETNAGSTLRATVVAESRQGGIHYQLIIPVEQGAAWMPGEIVHFTVSTAKEKA